MAENPHFRELLRLLNDFEARSVIVGGYAVMKYTELRYTKNLDVWVEDSADNALRLFGVLKQFGAPLESDGITPETFTSNEIITWFEIAFLGVWAHTSLPFVVCSFRANGRKALARACIARVGYPSRGLQRGPWNVATEAACFPFQDRR